MAITRQKKEQVVAQMKELLRAAVAIIAADNVGMTVEQITRLRIKARESGCNVKIAKNRLIRLALNEIGREGFDRYLTGPTLLVTHPDDAAKVAKVAVDFAKDCEKMVVKGGLLRKDVLDGAKVSYLAKLPGRTQLQSEFVGLINSLVGTVYFNGQNLLSEFTGLCEAQKEKLEAA